MEKSIKSNAGKSRVSKPSVKKSTGKKVNSLKPAGNNSVSRPSDEEIRALANEIYYSRASMGESGSDLEDWLQAESILINRKLDEQVA